jgi:hypothetical protein
MLVSKPIMMRNASSEPTLPPLDALTRHKHRQNYPDLWQCSAATFARAVYCEQQVQAQYELRRMLLPTHTVSSPAECASARV